MVAMYVAATLLVVTGNQISSLTERRVEEG
jgi:hypothetical protein